MLAISDLPQVWTSGLENYGFTPESEDVIQSKVLVPFLNDAVFGSDREAQAASEFVLGVLAFPKAGFGSEAHTLDNLIDAASAINNFKEAERVLNENE